MISPASLYICKSIKLRTVQSCAGRSGFKNIRNLVQTRKMSLQSYIVTPRQLSEALQDPNSNQQIVPLSAAWFLPNDAQKRTGFASFAAQHIPGSRLIDIDAVRDVSSPYPHMLPSATDFAKAMGEMGISNEDIVVVYDTPELGIFSAPRVGWMLKVFGHDKVHILNNFKVWVQEGYATESGKPQRYEAKPYKASQSGKPKEVVDFDYMKALVKSKSQGGEGAQILDARPQGRWQGTDPEPRPGLPSGHMPGSISLPFTDVLDPSTKTLLPAERLKQVFQDKNIDPDKTIINSCGSGVTAAMIDLALAEAGFGASPEHQRLLYDGSWMEWAQRVQPAEKLIVKTGD